MSGDGDELGSNFPLQLELAARTRLFLLLLRMRLALLQKWTKEHRVVQEEETGLGARSHLNTISHSSGARRWLLASNISEVNAQWDLYLKYREIVDMVLANEVPAGFLPYLEDQIQDFLRTYHD
ncbi:hypothetical protein HPB47_014213, partial [Ixodes persulcatus]